MKQLKEVKFPDDFTNPEAAIVGDDGINELIKTLSKEHYCVATGDALVFIDAEGYGFIEVYKLVASCEVEVGVDW